MWGRKEREVDSGVLADIEQQGAVPLHGQVGTNALPTRLVWAVNAVCLFLMKIKMSVIIALNAFRLEKTISFARWWDGSACPSVTTWDLLPRALVMIKLISAGY